MDEMIVALGFPLNAAAIILGCIFSTRWWMVTAWMLSVRIVKMSLPIVTLCRLPTKKKKKSDAVCVSGLSVGHGYLSMAVLFSSIEATLIEEQQ